MCWKYYEISIFLVASSESMSFFNYEMLCSTSFTLESQVIYTDAFKVFVRKPQHFKGQLFFSHLENHYNESSQLKFYK